MPQCENPTMRGMIRPLAELVAERRLASYEAVRPQVDTCRAFLAAVGVRAVTVGSYARGPSSFGDGSDVDILVLDAGGLTEREVYARIVEIIHPTPVDLMFATELGQKKTANMISLSRPYHLNHL